MQPVLTIPFCRLCLRVDVKLFKLNKSHETFIENILKIKELNYIRNENDYGCYICMALLAKCYKFIWMVWNAQAVLSNLLKRNQSSINKMTLKLIDRNECGLNPLNLRSFIVRSQITPAINVIKTDTNVPVIVSSSDEESNIDKCFDEGLVDEQNASVVEKQNASAVDDQSTYKDLLEQGNKKSKPGQSQTCVPRKERKIVYKEESSDSSSSSSSKKKLKKKRGKVNDDDYKPDSSSHSDDSLYDSFDDEGKPIKRPDREYPRKCDHCEYEVPRKGEHYLHYLYMHPNIDYPYPNQKVACSICGEARSIIHIDKHEAMHTVKKVSCSECGKSYRNTILLKKHELRVHTPKKYTCDYCSKSFKMRHDLILHIRTHTGEKPYKCHICGWRCAHGGNILLHIRSRHQNCGYVPKKRQQARKKRSNKTNADEALSGEEHARGKRRNTKNVRKRGNNSSRTKKNKNVDVTDTVSQDGEQENIQNVLECKQDNNENINNDKVNKCNSVNDEVTESDDENLAEIKRKKSLKTKHKNKMKNAQ